MKIVFLRHQRFKILKLFYLSKSRLGVLIKPFIYLHVNAFPYQRKFFWILSLGSHHLSLLFFLFAIVCTKTDQ
ncbi:MAG: hypothetical protein J7502_05545 [Flavisolibacter sp.]|nr:hypothetical protein [Flavisolibacter sp.]